MSESETRLTRGHESGSEPKLPGDDTPTVRRPADIRRQRREERFPPDFVDYLEQLDRRREAARRLPAYRDDLASARLAAHDPLADAS